MVDNILDMFSTTNSVFRAYLFYSAVLVVKMLAMSLLTARQRFKNKVFANPEDAVGKGAKVRFDNSDIERVRRAHLNDLENIPIFFVATFFYQFTNPDPFIAINLIRVFALSRILHTIVYAVFPLPQPSRALAWGVGYGITGYMAVRTILYFI